MIDVDVDGETRSFGTPLSAKSGGDGVKIAAVS